MGLSYGILSHPLVWLVTLAVQVFFIVDAIRSGKPIWIFVIFIFPMLGSLVYFFVEFLPRWRMRRGAMGALGADLARKLNPGAEIRRLEDQLAVNRSVQSRMELARAYLRVGRAEEAIGLYRECLDGVHGTDPRVLYELATAYHARGRLPEARETFERFRRENRPSKEQLLLSARIHEDAGDLESALQEYAPLARQSAGEEARTRYALLLRRVGRDAEARQIFEEVVRHARMSPSHYRRAEKPWVDIAKKELKAGRRAGV